MAAVTLHKVEKIYGSGLKAAHGTDLGINDGEFMVFVGPSGCVRSTTLCMIADLENVLGNEIYINGRLANTLPPKDHSIAMVFQNYVLCPHKTVLDNMAFGLKMQKRPKEETKEIVEEVAGKLEISDLFYRRPKEMSGGQRQRIAVGHAITRKPDVFLFGESLFDLDAKLCASAWARIAQSHQSLKGEGHSATIIHVIHDQIEASTLGNHICVFNQGQIMQVDTPASLYNHPVNRFVAGFTGPPSMDLIDAVVCEEDDEPYADIVKSIRLYIPENKQSALKAYIDKPVCSGIRPEYISLSLNCKEVNAITGTLSIIGNMGSEKYLCFTVNNKEFIVKIND